MEEGLPPLPLPLPLPLRPAHEHIDPPSSSAVVPIGPSTYVVQAPKDQIFRVPPPKNAPLVEQYRNEFNDKRRMPACYSHLAKGLAVALIVCIVCLVATLVLYLVVRPRDPAFSVKGILIAASSSSSGGSHFKPKFNITMTVKNPSARMGYFFDQGGTASLSDDHGECIASGEPPEFDVEHRNLEDFKLLLRATKSRLPEKVEKSLKGSKDVISLSLSVVGFSVRSEVAGIKLWSKRMDAACDVRVTNLAKGPARIVSQTCEAKFR